MPCRRFSTVLAPWVLAAVMAALGLATGAARAADDSDAAQVQELMSRGALESALQWARRNAEAKPRDAQAQFLVGVVLMDLGRDDEALAAFQQFSQAYPELPDPLNNIALLHVRAGRLEQAREALETALRSDPGHRLSRQNLGRVYLMLAVRQWELAAAGAPLEAPLQRMLEGARALLAGGPATPR